MNSISVVYCDKNATFTVDVELPTWAGHLSGLDPSACLILSVILARAGRSRGAVWPRLIDDEDYGDDAIKEALEAGLMNEAPKDAVSLIPMPRDERIDRLLCAVHDTRAELARVMYLLGEV